MMNLLGINNVYSASGKVDPQVGIDIAKIAGDEQLGLYCATLGPHKKVGAHFHKEGVEIYLIVEGSGIIHTGISAINGQVSWNPSVPVQKGDVFSITPGQVHQLENTGDDNLLLVFGCPASHLGNDRTMVKGIED
ncbi:MAG TPA: cupin domain-containing protein [Spirochaetia bacterium]|nr:cupin domain-containing protein [Spirochaetia bacterium]